MITQLVDSAELTLYTFLFTSIIPNICRFNLIFSNINLFNCNGCLPQIKNGSRKHRYLEYPIFTHKALPSLARISYRVRTWTLRKTVMNLFRFLITGCAILYQTPWISRDNLSSRTPTTNCSTSTNHTAVQFPLFVQSPKFVLWPSVWTNGEAVSSNQRSIPTIQKPSQGRTLGGGGACGAAKHPHLKKKKKKKK